MAHVAIFSSAPSLPPDVPRTAAVKRWPKDKITLRNRARVLEKSWRG
jgi:hypothetical protein